MAIVVEHSPIGPSIAVTGDDMFRLPALYYAGLIEPNYPVPAPFEVTAYHNWYSATWWWED